MKKIIFLLLLLTIIPFSSSNANEINNAVLENFSAYIGFTVGAPIITFDKKSFTRVSMLRSKLIKISPNTGMCLVEYPVTNEKRSKEKYWVHFTRITLSEIPILINSYGF